jgi:hypothetical protein
VVFYLPPSVRPLSPSFVRRLKLTHTFLGGSKGVLPGCILFGTICTGGQLIYSAANRWRQDTIVQSGLVDLPVDQDIPTKNLVKSVWDAIEIPSWSPIRKLSNDEYNALLDAKLKTLEDDIQQIEREMKRSAQDSTKKD